MRIIGTNFDIREFEEKDKSGFEQVMSQQPVFRPLLESASESTDIFWKIYSEAYKGSSLAVVDKEDTFVGFAHYESEEEDGQFELVLSKDFDYTGFGAELLPQILEYAYENTGVCEYMVELTDSEDVSKAIYEEQGFRFEEDGYTMIYRTGINV